MELSNEMKKTISLLLVLALVVGMFASMVFTANAATYNSGKRGTTCTSLSSKAKAYYTGNYTYAKLSAKSGSTLRTTLRTLIKSNYKTVGYNGLKTYFKYTDAYQGSTSKMLLFYSSATTTSSWDSGKTWNREHMWPQSLGGNAVEGDLASMRPADPTVNSTRNNNKYGEVASGYKTSKTSSANGSKTAGYYKNSEFEPLDNVKGDCARVVLYDYVLSSSMSSVTVVFESVDTLLAWNKSDPVDTYEMSRNDSVQSIQGNRNPFVDYPELGWLVLSRSIPSGLTTPSNGGSTGSSGSSSTGSSSSGTSYVTVSFSGATASSITTTKGSTITLPSPSSTASGYTFVGWTTSSVSSSTSAPTYYKAGTSVTVSGSVTLKALYKYTTTTSGSSSGYFTKVTSNPGSWAGTYLIVYEGSKYVLNGSLASVDAVSNYKTVSISSNKISASSAGNYAVTIAAYSTGYSIKTASGYYIGRTSDSNGLNASKSTKYVNKISFVSGGTVNISSGGAYLRYNATSGQTRFRYFKSSTYTRMKAICLYKLSGSTTSSGTSTTYYTTNP